MAGPAAADSLVHVDMWDKSDGTMGFTLSTAEVPAGKVTFELANVSTVMEHEFLIVKIDLEPAQFPMDADGTGVDEDKLAGVDEYGDVHKGESATWTTDVTPGNYLLFCNIEGHFGAGMWAKLTVTP